MNRRLVLGISLLFLGLGSTAGAQPAESGTRPAPAVEMTGGYAGVVDDRTIAHSVFGAAFRVHLTPRLSVGPELTYMRGPGDDRELIVTGNLTFDILSPGAARPRRVTPFLVVGGGMFSSSDLFNGNSFSHVEGAVTGGGGMRVWISRHVYAASELRIGWEPHVRITGTIGMELPR